MKKDAVIDIIMLSNYGRKDGGRETWLYNFLPQLLEDASIKKIHLFGFKIAGQEDTTAALMALDKSKTEKIVPIILEGTPKKYPKFISMHLLLRKYLKQNSLHKPDYVLAVGGMFETYMLLKNERFKTASRISWLRSIFTREKGYRIPSYAMKWFQAFEKKSLHKVDIVIVNGDDTRQFYEQYNLKIHTIKNAIQPKKWLGPDLQKSEVIQVAYIGRLSEVKGIEAFLEAAKKIKSSEYSAHFNFHIVGDANTYTEEVSKLHDEHVVVYHGAMNNDELPAFLKKIHVCVALTYVSKKLGGAGLSNALLEQMAAGKIIVAWSNDAFNQILTPTCAFQVEQYNNEALISSFISIYKNQEEALRKAIEAKKVIAPYTMQAHVGRFIKCLEKVD